MKELIKDFIYFIKEHKKYWLAPIFIILALMSTLIVVVQGTAVAPFIYALF